MKSFTNLSCRSKGRLLVALFLPMSSLPAPEDSARRKKPGKTSEKEVNQMKTPESKPEDDVLEVSPVLNPEAEAVPTTSVPTSSSGTTGTSNAADMEDRMVTEVAKESFYFGNADLQDLDEVLLGEGNFCLVLTTNLGRNVCELVVRNKVKQPLHKIPFVFNDKGCTLNGQIYNREGIQQLILEHINKKLPVDESGALVSQAIGRPVWQLKRENLVLGTKIGEGAFGTIYRGTLTDEGKAKDVAVKVTKINAENKDRMEDLTREARLMRQLDHPNVVRFFGIMNDGSFCSIVMELVEGGSLDKFMKSTTVPMLHKVKYCYDIGCGLHYLHEAAHLSHPLRNCLFLSKKHLVKLADFGMSTHDEKHQISPTEKSAIRWLSPESIRRGIYTRASDLWALGMTLSEIFNDGRQPFDKYQNQEIRKRICDPTFRPNLPKDVPSQVVEKINALWSHDPAKRPKASVVTSKLKEVFVRLKAKKHFEKVKKRSGIIQEGGEAAKNSTASVKRSKSSLKAGIHLPSKKNIGRPKKASQAKKQNPKS